MKIKRTKKIYDKFYVLFTDYSGTVTKNYQREKEIKRKDKDIFICNAFGFYRIFFSDIRISKWFFFFRYFA